MDGVLRFSNHCDYTLHSHSVDCEKGESYIYVALCISDPKMWTILMPEIYQLDNLIN